MTAKRYRVFKYYDGSGMWGISDDTAEYTVAYFDNHFEAENLCKVLNDLYEETQAQSIVIREYQNRCDNLHEENMELRKDVIYWRHKALGEERVNCRCQVEDLE